MENYGKLPVLCGALSPGMAHPQVVGGGDSLQIWRVTAYILNKLSGGGPLA
jgi:hypothetical protein